MITSKKNKKLFVSCALATLFSSSIWVSVSSFVVAPSTLSICTTIHDKSFPSLTAASSSADDAINVGTVAVAGATGRTGRFVVEELLNREGVSKVVALVRNKNKAETMFSTGPFSEKNEMLDIVQCDLSNKKQIISSLKDCDAAIWCASGVSDTGDPFTKAKALFDLTMKQSIDIVAVPTFANCFFEENETTAEDEQPQEKTPKVVFLSSAGVTRTTWDDEKKELLAGVAQIPIVRLNPFGILDIKRKGEELLRESGIPYAIVRPCGLRSEDEWPAGSRPLFVQGDVAAGRITRRDVAKVLVDVLSTPEATEKTFEVLSLAGYPPAKSIREACSRLRKDTDEEPSLDSVMATYMTLQQLLPGEEQDATQLRMGQSFEQLDRGESVKQEGIVGAVIGEPAPFVTASATRITTSTGGSSS